MPHHAAKLTRDKLNQIAVDPYARHGNVTKLRNRPGYRLRIGKWRAIFEIQHEEVVILVLKIATRGEIYR
jgi:mRNA interferase RelE/StbE